MSAFDAIYHVAGHFGAPVNPLLLADVTDRNPGSKGNALRRALNYSSAAGHPEWKFDESKLSIIYAFAHDMAARHPEEDIVLYLHDDHEKYLGNLFRFFNDNREWLPKNLTLRLVRNHLVADSMGS